MEKSQNLNVKKKHGVIYRPADSAGYMDQTPTNCCLYQIAYFIYSFP